MGLLDDRVAFVTGVARGMGRNHALRLAREGASIIGVDVASDVSPHNGYPAASEADLKETARLVEAEGRPCLMEIADVRNSDALEAVLADGVERFGGRLDVVVANAGISNWARHLAHDGPSGCVSTPRSSASAAPLTNLTVPSSAIWPSTRR